MVNYATNIYEVVDVLYYPTKVFGMAPYTKRKLENRKFIFVIDPLGLHHLILNGLVGTEALIFAVLRIYLETHYHVISFIDGIDGAMYILLQMATISTLGLFVIRQKYFISTLNTIEKADDSFRNIGVEISYKTSHVMVLLFLLVVYPFYLFTLANPIWSFISELVYEEGFTLELQKNACQFMNLAPTFVMRFVPIYFYSAFLLIAEQMFHRINGYVTEIELSSMSKNRQTVEAALTSIRVLHNLIYEITRLVTLAFSLPVFLHITLTFMEVICAIVVLQYSDHVGAYQVVFGSSFFVLTVIVVLIPCKRIMHEAEKTRKLICELSLPYFVEELAQKKKMLLLQMLHERIDLNACGFYDLNMEVITSHVGTICTLLMFFLQLRDVLIQKQ